MAQVFVDPLVHSPRVERVHLLMLGGMLAAIDLGLWLRWFLRGHDLIGFRLMLITTAIVAAAFFAGYYMMKRNRRILMARARLVVSEQGLVWESPAGRVEVQWGEVTELRIGMMASRTRTPDVYVQTERGALPAFMRWSDAAKPLPEPKFLSASGRFVFPDGQTRSVTPHNSELVAALAARVPAERIKRGVITSI